MQTVLSPLRAVACRCVKSLPPHAHQDATNDNLLQVSLAGVDFKGGDLRRVGPITVNDENVRERD